MIICIQLVGFLHSAFQAFHDVWVQFRSQWNSKACLFIFTILHSGPHHPALQALPHSTHARVQMPGLLAPKSIWEKAQLPGAQLPGAELLDTLMAHIGLRCQRFRARVSVQALPLVGWEKCLFQDCWSEMMC